MNEAEKIKKRIKELEDALEKERKEKEKIKKEFEKTKHEFEQYKAKYPATKELPSTAKATSRQLGN